MATATNGNNNIKIENVKEAVASTVKEAVASTVKNDGMRRRKQTTANSTTEWKESKYVIPPACTYQGNVFACLNGRLSARYNPRILCTRDHDNELGIASWDELMMHRGYENPNGSITPMQYENCPHSGCTKIVPSIQTSRKYHLLHDHEDVCRTILDLEMGVETTVIRDLLHEEKLYYTATGYVSKLECKFGANCGNKRSDHLEKYNHPKKNISPNYVEECSDNVQFAHDITTKHECKFGADCGNMQPEHLVKYTHPKKNCRFQPHCTNKSEKHCQQFVHTCATIVSSDTVLQSKTIACAFPTCWNNSDEHNLKYTHKPNQKGKRPVDVV